MAFSMKIFFQIFVSRFITIPCLDTKFINIHIYDSVFYRI